MAVFVFVEVRLTKGRGFRSGSHDQGRSAMDWMMRFVNLLSPLMYGSFVGSELVVGLLIHCQVRSRKHASLRVTTGRPSGLPDWLRWEVGLVEQEVVQTAEAGAAHSAKVEVLHMAEAEGV